MLDLMGDVWTNHPMVGREQELAAVLEALAPSEATDPLHHLIGGDAGVGKTRFTAAVVDELRSRGWRTVTGHCLDVESAVPYLPFSEALGRVAAEEPDLFESIVADAPSVTSLLPGKRMIGRVGGRADGLADGGDLIEGLHAFWDRLAETQPTLLVVEDVHWAGRSTIDLLTVLFSRPFSHPMAVIATVRSDDLHRRHPVRKTLAEWGRLPFVHRMELEALGPDEITRLVTGLQSSLTEERVDQIVSRAEGNAFFAEELALAGGIPGLPTDLSDVLLMRLDSLPAEQVSVVQAAACAGRQVSHRLLSAVVDEGSDLIEGALRAAVEANLMVPAGQDSYGFRHALLAEAIYDDLLPGEKVRLHARYAKALDAGLASGTAAELARHARLAGDLPAALRASVSAGDEAMAVSGPCEAVGHFESALGLLAGGVDPGPEIDRVSLVVRASEALYAANEGPRAVDLLLATLAEEGLSPRDRAWLHLIVTEISDDAPTLGEGLTPLELAMEHSERAVDLLTGEDSPLLARASTMRARVLRAEGRHEEAKQTAEEALRIAQSLGLERVSVDARLTLLEVSHGSTPDGEGDVQRTYAELDGLEEEASRIGYVQGRLRVLNLGEFVAEAARDRTASERFHSRLIQVAEEYHQPWAPYALGARLMWFYDLFDAGSWDRAEEMMSVVGPDAPPTVHAPFRGAGALLATARGDYEAAERVFSDLREEWPSTLPRIFVSGSPGLEVMAAVHGLEAAWTWFEECRSVLLKTGPQQEEVASRVRTTWIRLAAILLMVLNDRVGRSERDVWEERVEGVVDEVEDAVAYSEAGLIGTALDRARAAWALRFQAELAEFRGEQPTTWPEAIAEFEVEGNLYEAARSRVRSGVPEEVARGRAFLEEIGAIPHAEPAAADASLTGRENEILALVAEGLSNGEIGKRLFISTKTVSVHVSNILAKLGVSSRTEAAAHYLRSAAAD